MGEIGGDIKDDNIQKEADLFMGSKSRLAPGIERPTVLPSLRNLGYSRRSAPSCTTVPLALGESRPHSLVL
jgi:hypothetical protein